MESIGLRNEQQHSSLMLISFLMSSILIPNSLFSTPLREDSRLRYSFLTYMYDDRNESAFSYYEFLHHLQTTLDK